MWAVVAVIAFSVALVLRLASVSKGVFLAPDTFVLIGFIALAVEHISPGWRPYRRAQ